MTYVNHPVYFYVPSFKKYEIEGFNSSGSVWPAVSVTGERCSFNCKHCGRVILKEMVDGSTPEKLVEAARRVEKSGGHGLLLSGGCVEDGSVPLERFKAEIREISSKLTVFAHTGVVSPRQAKILAECGVKVAMVDVVGDVETVKLVLGQPFKPRDYLHSLLALKSVGIKIAPHVVMGLHFGKVRGEFKALEFIRQADPDAVVMVAATQMKGTVFEDVEPPSLRDMMMIVRQAREQFSEKPVVLGCARPRDEGRRRLDEFCVHVDLDGVAFPTEEAIEAAKKLGRPIVRRRSCCVDMILEEPTRKDTASSSTVKEADQPCT